MNAYDIIKKPLLSEKCYAGIAVKKYGFLVDRRADKVQIRIAIEEIFGVKVEKVNTVNLRGKLKRQGKHSGYTPKIKKAYVQLSASSKPIEFFESLS
ncbi:MAG: 50S ribosomal protein L23 [Firmicutes bacterium]|nr:50S ribosomal protein L23 [Bacillota bacterium]